MCDGGGRQDMIRDIVTPYIGRALSKCSSSGIDRHEAVGAILESVMLEMIIHLGKFPDTKIDEDGTVLQKVKVKDLVRSMEKSCDHCLENGWVEKKSGTFKLCDGW